MQEYKMEKEFCPKIANNQLKFRKKSGATQK